MDPLTRAVQLALLNAPVSLRQLSRRTGLSHVLLSRIVAGKRRATWPVAQAMAQALHEVSFVCDKEEERLRKALTIHGRRDT